MGKYYYRIYGLTLASDYEFPQFVSIDAPEGETDISVIYGGISNEINEFLDKNIPCGFKGEDLWFRNGMGVFWIHDNTTINFKEYGGSTVAEAAMYIPGMCLSILLWNRGILAIHGACLRLNDKTIIIAGNSGSGKTTLTNELIKKGALLIADDITAISNENGSYLAYPAFPFQKLCLDQVEKNEINTDGLRQVKYDLNKFEIPRSDVFYDKPTAVDAMFRVDIGKTTDAEIKEVEGADKLQMLIDSLFIRMLFNDNFSIEPEDIFRCINFAKDVNLYRIVRNKQKDTLNMILGFIEEKIS